MFKISLVLHIFLNLVNSYYLIAFVFFFGTDAIFSAQNLGFVTSSPISISADTGFLKEEMDSNLSLVKVASLNSIGANKEFQQNVKLVQEQRALAISLTSDLESASSDIDIKDIRNQLDSLTKKLNENNQLMFETYGFTLNRNYVLKTIEADLLMWITKEEKDSIESNASSSVTFTNNSTGVYLVPTLGSWTWNGSFPWVYNHETASWFYYHFAGNTYNAYDARNGNWFTFNSTSNSWVKSN